MSEEGWYRDPYGLHQDRWISEGKPTRLVRDDGVEHFDEPPTWDFMGDLVPVDEPEETDGRDLIRADAPDANAQPNYVKAVLDVFRRTRPTR